jgi:hypothetical protein
MNKLRTLLNAVRTGLEPATPCVTGRYSNQLNYRTFSYLTPSFEGARCRFYKQKTPLVRSATAKVMFPFQTHK